MVEEDLQTGPPGAKKHKSQGKNSQTFAQHFQGKPICKAFNDGRGCKSRGKGKGCPNGGQHVCDVNLPSGKPSGSKNHCRSGHR